MKKLIYLFLFSVITTIVFAGSFHKEIYRSQPAGEPNEQSWSYSYTIPCHDITSIYLAVWSGANGEGSVTAGNYTAYTLYSKTGDSDYISRTGTDLHTSGYVSYCLWTRSGTGSHVTGDAYIYW